ncbi:GNAT family N-acetyltransferase [Sporomusa silvacetica]
MKEITVNSSPYAVLIYEKMGFVRTDVEQEINGIRFIPMKFNIPARNQ